MKNISKTNLNIKLTLSAEKALDEFLNDYRNQIILGADEIAKEVENNEFDEITVKNIFESIYKIQSISKSSSSRKTDFLFQTYSVIGLLMGLIGIGSFLISVFKSSITTQQQIFLMIGFMGITLSILSFIILNWRQKNNTPFNIGINKPESQNYSMALISEWKKLELFMRNYVSHEYGESVANAPLSYIIMKLLENHVIEADEEKEIRMVLTIRNEILHKGLVVSRMSYFSTIKIINKYLSKFGVFPIKS